MTDGHGDDAYRYADISVNFSSNIYSASDLSPLKRYLCSRMEVIDHYPEPEARRLEHLVASRNGIAPECVLVTSGATEAIYLAAHALCHMGCGSFALASLSTFSEYEDASRMFGMKMCEDTFDRTRTVMWLCNPNNPTGVVFGDDEVRNIAARYAYVVIDQSYERYTLQPLMSHAEAAAMPNVLQIHSFTKDYAIPGLRIGYVVGNARLVGALRRLLRPWSVNALAIEAATWLLQNDVHAIPDLAAYLAETQRLRRNLDAIRRITASTTQTNFFLCQIEGVTAAELKDYLAREHRMLIRDASNFRGLTPSHFRVAAQSPRENDRLTHAIAAFCM